ncbi:TatD family deoxyribonuclease [Microbulbifer sp. A4B17]|uniref:TatD family hydrolase n=1 Tax=Microbulbifer sp. A4B17 TaxID=359370 RepID=UPI000D52CF91|nr:TatD family hydrolase [Microbulbifer sp. A4B17]AWF80804.1 TatD family deoxyribonuclease [Microbulbifer sp. A4B17]
MKFIDSHCHFDFEAFSKDRDQIWQRCISAGIDRVIIPSVCEAQWQSLGSLVSEQPGWMMAAGLHPWWVEKVPQGECRQESLTELGQRLSDSLEEYSCVAVGECGLDASIKTAMGKQEDILKIQLDIACSQDLPVILHVHRAHNELLRLLKQFRLPRGGVIHAFSGSEQMAQEYWKRGFYLGIGGTITYPRAAKTRRAISCMPLESLLLESDAPDMPLSGQQGMRNTPENLSKIAQALAELRGVSVQEIADATCRNTEKLFSL